MAMKRNIRRNRKRPFSQSIQTRVVPLVVNRSPFKREMNIKRKSFPLFVLLFPQFQVYFVPLATYCSHKRIRYSQPKRRKVLKKGKSSSDRRVRGPESSSQAYGKNISEALTTPQTSSLLQDYVVTFASLNR